MRKGSCRETTHEDAAPVAVAGGRKRKTRPQALPALRRGGRPRLRRQLPARRKRAHWGPGRPCPWPPVWAALGHHLRGVPESSLSPARACGPQRFLSDRLLHLGKSLREGRASIWSLNSKEPEGMAACPGLGGRVSPQLSCCPAPSLHSDVQTERVGETPSLRSGRPSRVSWGRTVLLRCPRHSREAVPHE